MRLILLEKTMFLGASCNDLIPRDKIQISTEVKQIVGISKMLIFIHNTTEQQGVLLGINDKSKEVSPHKLKISVKNNILYCDKNIENPEYTTEIFYLNGITDLFKFIEKATDTYIERKL